MSMPQAKREVWTDMYKLHEHFYAMGNTVDDWTLWWRTANSIMHKHNDSELVKNLIFAISTDLEDARKMPIEEEPCEETQGQSSPDTQSGSSNPSQLGMF